MLVIDASVLVAALAEQGALGTAARARLQGEQLSAPELIDLEVASVLRRLVLHDAVTQAHAAAAMTGLAEMPLQRYRHRALLRRCWDLRQNVSAYDAAYVALAELLDVPLVTGDRRLANAPGPRCTVEVLDVSDF